MKIIENVTYLSKEEWFAKGFIILHCQTSFLKDENEIELFSEHQVKKEKKENNVERV